MSDQAAVCKTAEFSAHLAKLAVSKWPSGSAVAQWWRALTPPEKTSATSSWEKLMLAVQDAMITSVYIEKARNELD